MEPLAQDRLWGLRAELTQKYYQRIDPVLPYFRQRLQRIVLIFHSDRTFVHSLTICSSKLAQHLVDSSMGKQSPGHGDNAQLHFGNILFHDIHLSFALLD